VSESAFVKGRRYLAEGRLVVDRVDADCVHATCRGEGARYDRWLDRCVRLGVLLSCAWALLASRRVDARHCSGRGGGMNLPRIDKPATASELRDRVLAQMNGESSALSRADRERRRRVLAAVRKARG
jgi:hypothetical protein